jgi:hypothetical protein
VEGVPSLLDSSIDIEQAREQLLGMEQRVLEQLYRQRSLCRAEFDYQAEALLAGQGHALFCRHDGNRDNWALMIDDWQMVAVGPDDVRSQYGYFCEASEAVDEAEAEQLVMKWLATGAAYDDYRAKTHCRYCQ